jgi:hypothetical protein
MMKTMGQVFCELVFHELKSQIETEISAVWQWHSAALSSSSIGVFHHVMLTIYGPMIYTAPRIRILMRADG